MIRDYDKYERGDITTGDRRLENKRKCGINWTSKKALNFRGDGLPCRIPFQII